MTANRQSFQSAGNRQAFVSTLNRQARDRAIAVEVNGLSIVLVTGDFRGGWLFDLSQFPTQTRVRRVEFGFDVYQDWVNRYNAVVDGLPGTTVVRTVVVRFYNPDLVFPYSPNPPTIPYEQYDPRFVLPGTDGVEGDITVWQEAEFGSDGGTIPETGSTVVLPTVESIIAGAGDINVLSVYEANRLTRTFIDPSFDGMLSLSDVQAINPSILAYKLERTHIGVPATTFMPAMVSSVIRATGL